MVQTAAWWSLLTWNHLNRAKGAIMQFKSAASVASAASGVALGACSSDCQVLPGDLEAPEVVQATVKTKNQALV